MYGTIAGLTTYLSDRGSDLVVDQTSMPALVRASDYIKYHYVANFRTGVDADNLPEVELATYEAAKIELQKPGFFSKTFSTSQAKVLVAIDDIRWEKVAQGSSDQLDHYEMVPISGTVDMYLRGFMRRRHTSGIFSVGGSR